jgi:hypothetical protein
LNPRLATIHEHPLKAVFSLCALLVCSATGFAQTAQPLVKLDNTGCPSADAREFGGSLPDSLSATIGSRINESPDIVLLASVHADQVRFAKQPEIRVRLCWGGDSLRVIERTNLPSPVVAGTTYRDVFINLEILGHVNAACLASRITGVASDSTAKGSCAGLSAGLKR